MSRSTAVWRHGGCQLSAQCMFPCMHMLRDGWRLGRDLLLHPGQIRLASRQMAWTFEQ